MIQPGQILDKYELLECVGHGGMASVYRGFDSQLKRTVAVKILHRHLSDHPEARHRFEREAQAVAKLRHDNILEIYDYSAHAGSDSYIVTEFIDGQTLRHCITERPMHCPEIGAMVMLQVCRALSHAHGASILHRDVKPENIMIRSDGVVKLMDFGIAHMVDLERLTVTGQLLGSPAYMAPEHVEGRPLDFRSDVFAAGTVLYQLAVGTLPFEGRNPHEVLKRIGECEFVDPRHANRRVGNRLGRIILTAMARAPQDRYQQIAEMVAALEAYLAESGLDPDKVAAELAHYFAAPVDYEAALSTRLVATLTRVGQDLLARNRRAAALDVFDRVLAIDPRQPVVAAILKRLHRRTRLRELAMAALVIAAIVTGGYAIHRRSRAEPVRVPDFDVSLSPPLDPSAADTARDNPPPREPRPAMTDVAARPVSATTGQTDSPVPSQATAIEVTVAVAGSEYRLENEATWQPISGKTFTVPVADRTMVEVRNPYCPPVKVPLQRELTHVDVIQPFSPASIVAKCATPDVSVSIDGASFTLGSPKAIEFDKNALSKDREVVVVFTSSKAIDRQRVMVTAGQSVEVKCALH